MRHNLRNLVASCLVAAGPGLAGGAAMAASPQFDVSALPVGTVFRWRAETGTATERYLGRDGASGYKFSFQRDDSGGTAGPITSWMTRDGQITRVEGPGISDQYLPNDCSLTLGRCKYIVIHQDGSRDSMISITSEEDGRWTYELFHNRISEATRTEYGTFTVDRHGIILNRSYVLSSGKRGWVRRLEK